MIVKSLMKRFLIIFSLSIIFLLLFNLKVYGKTLEVDGQKYEFPDTYIDWEHELNFEKYYDDLDFESYKNLEDKGHNEILAKYNYDMELEEAAYFCLKYGEKYFNKEYISLKTLNWVYAFLKKDDAKSENFDKNILLKAQEMITNVAVYRGSELTDWREDVKDEQENVSEEKKKAADDAWARFQKIKSTTNFDELSQDELYEIKSELTDIEMILLDAKRDADAAEVRNFQGTTTETMEENAELEYEQRDLDYLKRKDSKEHSVDEIVSEATNFAEYTRTVSNCRR